MAYLLSLCQILLAAVFLLAAAGKLLNSEQFLAALRLSHTPTAIIRPVSVLVPLLELTLALGLLLNTSPWLSLFMIGVIGLLAIFTVWMVLVYMRGLRLKCGCFGTASRDVGPSAIGRNLLLLVIATGGFLLSRITQSLLPPPSLWMVIIVCSLGMCLVLLQAFQQSRGALILQTSQILQAQEAAELPSSLEQ